jgi:hypothetical protein
VCFILLSSSVGYRTGGLRSQDRATDEAREKEPILARPAGAKNKARRSVMNMIMMMMMIKGKFVPVLK